MFTEIQASEVRIIEKEQRSFHITRKVECKQMCFVSYIWLDAIVWQALIVLLKQNKNSLPLKMYKYRNAKKKLQILGCVLSFCAQKKKEVKRKNNSLTQTQHILERLQKQPPQKRAATWRGVRGLFFAIFKSLFGRRRRPPCGARLNSNEKQQNWIVARYLVNNISYFATSVISYVISSLFVFWKVTLFATRFNYRRRERKSSWLEAAQRPSSSSSYGDDEANFIRNHGMQMCIKPCFHQLWLLQRLILLQQIAARRCSRSKKTKTSFD